MRSASPNLTEAAGTQADELGQDPIRYLPLAECLPSPENDRLYRPIDPDDADIIALARSIATFGLKEPLVVTLDGWILSGHRRRVAAESAGLEEVPCRIEQITRNDDSDGFLRLLREYNRQREKTRDEKLREAVVEADPEESYQSLLQHRKEQQAIGSVPMVITGRKRRAQITLAKRPFLDTVLTVLGDRREYWPLSDRQIHYALLNAPPLRHRSKPHSLYANDVPSYKSLVDLLTRARLAGLIPMEAIADETRPVSIWDVHRDSGAFLRREVDGLFKGYWRDLMQSQPNQIELVGEKNTVLSILKPVAAQYTIPLTTGPRLLLAAAAQRDGAALPEER